MLNKNYSTLSDLPSGDIKSYSINFLRLGGRKQENQHYIHPAKTIEELENEFFFPIIKCALVNKTASVNLWYDSLRNSNNAIENTRKY